MPAYFKTLAAQNKYVTVKGKLNNTPEKSKLYLYEIDIQSIVPLDSTVLKKNGKFSFNIYTNETKLLLLRTNKNIMIKLAANPGEIININGDFNDLLMTYTLDGSNDSEIIRRIDQKMMSVNQKIHYNYNILNKQPAENKERIYDSINVIINETVDEFKLFLLSLINETPSSLASLIAINQVLMNKMIINYENDLDTYIKLNKSLLEKHPNNKHVSLFNNNLMDYLNLKAEHDAIEQRAGIGVKANDITLFDTDSNKISLSDLKGKTILLHFWNPSCDVCREENKLLHQLYQKYRNMEFEIFAVSIGTSWRDWIYAINEDKINTWKNVKIPEEGIDVPNLSSYYVALYGVKSIPYSFLIDKNGFIINKGFKGDVMDELLQDVLQ